MSLFPAYGLDAPAGGESECTVVAPPVPRWAAAGESELLASSDSDAEPARAGDAARGRRGGDEPREGDYYEDRRFDGGNLRVSTIYYPGRPQYSREESSRAIGLRGAARAGRKRARRYWERAAPDAGAGAGACAGGAGAGGAGAGDARGEGERAAALRRALRERPEDELLWLQYIEYQEWVSGAAAALAAATDAAARAPGAGRLRARRLRLLRRTLAPREYLTALRDMLAEEKEPAARGALWARLVSALGAGAAGDEGPRAARDAAAAAARDLRRLPAAYPLLLLNYGLVLRAGGLWEALVQLLELLLALHRAAPAPPAAEPAAAAAAAAERALLDYEDKVIASGLPSDAVWARVERARAAAHWRPAPGAGDGDPQRAPAAADAAELLLPLAAPDALLLLAAAVLRLAKVPLLPGAEYVHAAAGRAGDGEADGGEALLALLRAARRLPRPPAAARDLVQLAVDPPHYFSDEYGFRSWVDSLWDAVLEWAGDAGGAEGARAALLCWRLRWLHSLLLLVEDPESTEAVRLRGAARAALRRWGGGHAVPFALWARLAPAPAGPRAAGLALRAALRDAATPDHHLLYVARIVQEVCPEAEGAEGLWAVASAVLRRALPDDLRSPPPPALLQEARAHCEKRCMELEAELQADPGEDISELGSGAELCAALLPGTAEWGAARALLAPPARRAQLLQALLEADAGRGRQRRWREQAAAALARLAPGGARHARELSARYPENALLALMAGDASPWAPWSPAAPLEGARALAAALPALLRAVANDWEPEAAGAAARALRRAGGGAALRALRLEAEARAPRPRLERAVYAALDDLPAHKWLAVRGAALGAAPAAADLLLERGLRLHALPDELLPATATNVTPQ